MRAGRRTGLVLATGIALLIGARVSAHRRDEYLQATRVAIEPASIDVELDLTPGIAVADSIVAAIDRDGDGAFSSAEQAAYVTQVLNAIDLRADGRPVTLVVNASRFPVVAALRRGEGTIQIRSRVSVRSSIGAHQLVLRNSYRPDVSVYLANALVSESDRIAVTAQRRDPEQRELALEYAVRAEPVRDTIAWLRSRIAAFTLSTYKIVE